MTVVVSSSTGREVGRDVQAVTVSPPPAQGDLAFTISTGTVLVGQCATLTVSGDGPLDVLVKGAGAPAFTTIKTLPSGGSMAICPSTNSLYDVRNSAKTAPAQVLLVKAIQTLVVTRHGQQGTFSGHVIPGVIGRRVDVFSYVDGGHVQRVGTGAVGPHGNFSFTAEVNRPGKKVHFFSVTYKDDYNSSGRSRLITVQY